MTPSEYYQKLLQSDQILPDEQQARVVQQLEIIYNALLEQDKQNTFFQRLTINRPVIKGLYLWGSVGIGKTFLMDSFYFCLPFKEKLRTHFHEFMKNIHKKLESYKKEKEPIKKIAKEIGKNYKVICFDELVVNDIADAMLLAGLFEQLYKEKVCLLYTSNTPPDELYLKGIQRESFLPAIALLKQYSEIIHLTTTSDYRYRSYIENTTYYTPLNEATTEAMNSQFEKNSRNERVVTGFVRVLGRDIPIQKMADGVIWFDFLGLCGVPRSQNDYLSIAKDFDIILLSNLKAIKPEQKDLARAFINLVDVMYDNNKKLIISAEKPIEEIYPAGQFLFEFARTRSRLIEMQTQAWQQQAQSAEK